MSLHRAFVLNRLFILTAIFLLTPIPSLSQSGSIHPWSNSSLDPDERASMVVKEMTLNEKISMLHGTGIDGP